MILKLRLHIAAFWNGPSRARPSTSLSPLMTHGDVPQCVLPASETPSRRLDRLGVLGLTRAETSSRISAGVFPC